MLVAESASCTRRFGDCYLGLELWKRLQLDEFLTQHMDGNDADVPWSRVAAVLAINRLCDPGSELAAAIHLVVQRIETENWAIPSLCRATLSATVSDGGQNAGWLSCLQDDDQLVGRVWRK